MSTPISSPKRGDRVEWCLGESTGKRGTIQKIGYFKWCKDGEGVDLPTEDVIEMPEGVDLEEEIPEELSKRYDFLVEGYCYEVVA